MADSYPDAPHRRMGWDSDGTQVTYWQGTVWCTGSWDNWSNGPYYFTDAQKKELNDEDTVYVFGDGGALAAPYFVAWIFPEKRDIYGLYTYHWSYNWYELTTSVETSTNTNDGLTGDWTTEWADFPGGNGGLYNVQFGHRLEVRTPSSTITGVKAIRIAFTCGSSLGKGQGCAVHFYGEISAGETPDRMLYINNSTGLEYDGPLDWGDIQRGVIYDEAWYMKNNSSTLTANNTRVQVEALYGNSDTFYTFSTSTGSASFSTSLGPVATIAAGARWPASDALVIRNDPPSTADLGLHDARLVMSTSSWS